MENNCPQCGLDYKAMDSHNKWLGTDSKTWYCQFSHLPTEYQAKLKGENPGNPFIASDHIQSAFNMHLELAKVGLAIDN